MIRCRVFREVRCNKAGVDLEPIFEREDLTLLEALIRKHLDYTGSPLAKQLLAELGRNGKEFCEGVPEGIPAAFWRSEKRRGNREVLPKQRVPAAQEAAVAEAGGR